MITVIALLLLVVGALNWLSVGIFDFNFINWIFTSEAYVGARILYAIVGVAGIWTIVYLIYNKFNPKRINAIEKGAKTHDHE
ncbi:MAG TPA: DUF378 domain-containing protein [Candidatus Ornithoclostridium faecavium]|nr:DUF378 domain-containing protein [Candidatus Ornithoclostridium faecavium]